VEGNGPGPEDPLIPPPEGDDSGLRGTLADGVKKALLAGIGALFMTEEGARRMARDWKLPKDVANFIGQQAQGAKDDILRMFSDEVRRFLESEAVRGEFLKALTEHSIEIRAEIRFKPAGGHPDAPPKPEVTAEVKPKRGPKGKR
jgi:hypothetical protein